MKNLIVALLIGAISQENYAEAVMLKSEMFQHQIQALYKKSRDEEEKKAEPLSPAEEKKAEDVKAGADETAKKQEEQKGKAATKDDEPKPDAAAGEGGLRGRGRSAFL